MLEPRLSAIGILRMRSRTNLEFERVSENEVEMLGWKIVNGLGIHLCPILWQRREIFKKHLRIVKTLTNMPVNKWQVAKGQAKWAFEAQSLGLEPSSRLDWKGSSSHLELERRLLLLRTYDYLPLSSFAHACEGRSLQAGTPEIAIAIHIRRAGLGAEVDCRGPGSFLGWG
uniref:Uncharacterized protein n=1 Tax=Ananas comosus var. bracteatus TaxID=296719 RepID=A0A6V7NXT4_ANACO|nr:unnamed protein product [Ananas comosus var. bracteatus]